MAIPSLCSLAFLIRVLGMRSTRCRGRYASGFSRLLALLLLATAEAALALAQGRPNIVLIVADDIGYSDFGAFGGEIDTPNIDALASGGMRFSNFHVASSCAPTRAMLLTGVDNHVAGVGSMRELMPLSHRGKPGYEGVLNARVQTFASILQASGYRTSIAGKWHLGVGENNLPPVRGFDYSFIQADSGADNFEMRPYLPMALEARWYENGQRLQTLPQDFYSSRHFVDKTIEYIGLTPAGEEPFFAYVAFQANHTPIQAPAAFIDAYRGRYTEGWGAVRDARLARLHEFGLLDPSATPAPGFPQAQWEALSEEQRYFEARRMQAYAGMATAMDHEVGRLVAHLKAIDEYRNTVFIVLSDNGAVANEPYDNNFGRRWLEKHYHRDVETLGSKGSWVAAGRHWGRVSNTPFSGVKFTAGEGGVRVPLIVSGAPVAAVGKVSHAFTHVTDIAPTLLALAGIDTVHSDARLATMSGKSLVPLLKSEEQQLHRHDRPIGYEFSGNAALYRGDFKLVKNLPPAGDGQWRLFNLKDDPGETVDLSKRLTALFRDMQGDYRDYAATTGVLEMPENYELAKQVAINSLLFVYLPEYFPLVLGVLIALVTGIFFWRRLRSSGRGSAA